MVILFTPDGGGNGIFSFKSNEVSIIELTGEISSNGGDGGIFGGYSPSADEYIKLLDNVENNDGVKAVVLKINSPGGEVVASEKLARKVKEVSEKKPVVAYIETIGASGAYMAAVPSDYIVAEKHSMVGSIGVIMGLSHYYELYEKIGINTTTIKAGKYKDIGSPNRPMTDEEKKMLESMTDEMYGDFIKWVAENRGMDINKTYEVAEGKIYTGSQAKKAGLVDAVGVEQDAIDKASELANISNPTVVYYDANKPAGLFGLSINDIVYHLGYGIGRGLNPNIEQKTIKLSY
ncbi:signal peptide peptidase SppA [Methanococcus aeolicus]|uniref:signal peptide peptidase SppA n=1 Tax=Methanococcus aeolicus TaxID=42879 RepID=UPI0021C5A62E|nr:signal peptide peptidase SppA [Methanococcus aeolicus]UXM85550.1 signal peptide peptidase SppA [Methanococcus aeolicus]